MGKSSINGPFSMAMLNNQRVLSVVHMFDETKRCVVGFLCNSVVAEEQQRLSVETSTHGSRVTNPKDSVVGENSL